MEYSRFLRLRRPLWEDLEGQLRQLEGRRPAPGAGAPGAMSYAGLERLALTYRQVLHDHALAATRFAGTGAARQLATLAIDGTRLLTRRSGPGLGWRALRRFARHTFPAAFQRQLGLLGVAILVFGTAMLFGLALSAAQPGLGTALLGPRTIEKLAEGHLWTESLTTAVPPAVASSGIATNNLGVALFAWSGGVLAGIVPLYVLTLNGLLLGGLLGVTLRYSMAGELLSFVAAHGPLEITLILVTSTAGLALGRALVSGGERPRAEAMRLAGNDSLNVVLGCLPWFVVLGMVEARISPDPSVPVAFKIALGLSLELLFFGAALAPGRAEEGADDGND